MKRFVIVLLCLISGVAASAQDDQAVKAAVSQTMEEFTITDDQIIDDIRYVSATPSAKVCSKKIDIQIKDDIILSVVYTRGCDGNAKGIGALIKGMTVEEAIRRLEGITCGNRPTSCPDQLAKILKSL